MCIESEVKIEGDAQRFIFFCETGTRDPAAFMCIMGPCTLCCIPRSVHSYLSEFNTNALQENLAYYSSSRQSSRRNMFNNAVATEIVMYICVFHMTS